MNDSILRSVRLIDRERREIESAGIKVAAKIGRQAMRFAVNARRFGHDAQQATKSVLLGAPNSDHASVADVLTRVMLVSNLKGRRRSILNARPHLSISLARSPEQKLRDEEEALLALLLLSDEELFQLEAEYRPIARTLVSDAVAPLLDRVTGGPAEIRTGFADAGFVGAPFAIENIFSTAGVRGYEDGRFASWQKPQIRESLFGFHYSAILDDRTTELCQSLDGTVAPKDDPFWRRFTPPNHFRCRSTLIEVWRSDALNEPSVIQPDATAEQMNRFIAEKARFLSYF